MAKNSFEAGDVVKVAALKDAPEMVVVAESLGSPAESSVGSGTSVASSG